MPVWKTCTVRRRALAAGAFGVFLGLFASGHPAWFSFSIALTSLAATTLSGVILGVRISGFEDLKKGSNLPRFFVGALAGPLLGAILATSIVAPLVHDSNLFAVAFRALLSDCLGLLVILPPLLFALTGKYRDPRKLAPHLYRATPYLVIYTLAVVAVFSQAQYPLLFCAFPAMILLLASMGLEGGVLISAITTAVAFWATVHGFGPIHLITSSASARVAVLQVFLWMVAATALPVGALWDERRRSEQAAAEAGTIYQTLLAHAEDMIILSSFDGAHRYVSPACEKMTGWTPDEFLALDRLTTFHPDDYAMGQMVLDSIYKGKQHHQFRYRLAQKEGGWRWVEASITAYLHPTTREVAGYVGTLHDITEHYHVEKQRDALARARAGLELLAATDQLTGLPNRRAFDTAMQASVFAPRGAQPNGAPARGVLMLIDIDNFKLYNDTYGHESGDRALCAVAQALLTGVSRENDFVGRWGGEEFVVLLPSTSLSGAETVAAELLRAVRNLAIDHSRTPRGHVTISIGMAPLDQDSRADSRAWLQKADRALYESKRSGKDQVSIYTAMYESTEAVA